MNLQVIALILSLCMVTTIKCGEYYRNDGRTYYSSYPEMRNWYQAKRYCTYLGMYLVDVHTDAENKRILSVINNTESITNKTGSYWTSGTDLGSEGNFYWDTTGHAFLYADWAKNQPDNSGGEHCVDYHGSYKHKLNDFNCDNQLYFICRDNFDVPSYKSRECSGF